eukprot:COSAG02_NODE_14651_length_1251_cov_1.376736_1_plen_286_part_00
MRRHNGYGQLKKRQDDESTGVQTRTGSTMATAERELLRLLWILVVVGMFAVGWAGAGSTPTEIVCEENEENRWAQLTPLGKVGETIHFNISNVTFAVGSEHQVVVDLVLYGDRTELMLPNGMMVRVVTPEYHDEDEMDLSLDGLMDMQQSLWEIMVGNLLGTLICCALLGLVIFLEKKYQCIGSEGIHSMVEMQHQLHEDLEHATHFLDNVQKDPSQLNGTAAAIAYAYQAAIGADKVAGAFSKRMDEVRIPLLLTDFLTSSLYLRPADFCASDTTRGCHRLKDT